MALQTCSIKKNGSSLQILNYTNNSASSASDQTYTSPMDIRVWITSTNTINIKIGTAAALDFTQTTGGRNKISAINDVDTSAYTAAQIRDLLNYIFAAGFGSTLSYMYRSQVNLHLTTSAMGATYVAFADTPNINGVDVVNSSGTALEFIIDGAGVSAYLPDNSGTWIGGITNANQISIRRVDVSNTPVTITARAIAI